MAKIKPKTLKPKTREKVDEWKRTLAGLAEHLRTLAVDIDGFPEQGDKKSVDDALYDSGHGRTGPAHRDRPPSGRQHGQPEFPG